MRLSDENTREGRHLTLEERIALQAEEIKQLWQALRKVREEVQNVLDNYELVGEHEYDISEHLQIALAEIDKAIGGKEDVTSMGD